MSENKKTGTVEETLKQLAETIASGNIPKADTPWASRDIRIVSEVPHKTEDAFYPDPRYVVTEYPLEVSWVFSALKNAFYDEDLLDGCSKVEFFGRLANAATRAIEGKPEISCPDLCKAVTLEAETIYNELTRGEFHCLSLGIGNEIFDDSRKKSEAE